MSGLLQYLLKGGFSPALMGPDPGGLYGPYRPGGFSPGFAGVWNQRWPGYWLSRGSVLRRREFLGSGVDVNFIIIQILLRACWWHCFFLGVKEFGLLEVRRFGILEG